VPQDPFWKPPLCEAQFALPRITLLPAWSAPADIPILRGLIEASGRGLQSQHYTPDQIESALATVYGVDTRLTHDGADFLAEAPEETSEIRESSDADTARLMVGCGG
jgi:hypothetical protein